MKTSVFSCLVLSILSLFAGKASAQTSQIATLLHDESITNYYGGTALVEAIGNAVDGDVITLSSGVFTACDLTKPLTIRGAGAAFPEMGTDYVPTVLAGDFSINYQASDEFRLSIEGIQNNEMISFYNAPSLRMTKCRFNKISPNSIEGYDFNDILFLHCEVQKNNWNVKNSQTEGSISFINSVVKDFESNKYDNWTFSFNNCILNGGPSFDNTAAVNSIVNLVGKPGSNYVTNINASCSMNNCLITNCTNYKALNGGNKFKNGALDFFQETGYYELIDEYKSFLGLDGSEIGIHGGSLPFDPLLSLPRISRFKVAPKTTADGKLSVDIEVTGVE